MRAYVLGRLVQSLITLFLATIVVFAGIRALPGDAALALAGEERTPEALEQIREKYGLDQPVPVQYARWVGLAVTGDLGESTRTGLDVTTTILQRIPVTLELATLALLFAILLGTATGVVAAVRRGRPSDWLANGFALFGLSIPNFWLGLMLILLFAVIYPVFPASGYVPFTTDPLGNLLRMVMPAFVLGTGIASQLMRQTRSSMLESLGADYVRTARAKGLSEWQVLVGHALRNSLITVLTILGIQLGVLISGSVVTEQIFVIPGFGRLIVEAVFTRDYPVIQGVALVTAAGYITINLVVDLLYSVVDPRIRVSGAAA